MEDDPLHWQIAYRRSEGWCRFWRNEAEYLLADNEAAYSSRRIWQGISFTAFLVGAAAGYALAVR